MATFAMWMLAILMTKKQITDNVILAGIIL
jgi:hypothetical protein